MLLTTEQIRTVFAEEIQSLGGTVHEAFDDGARLFARSVLPDTREIQRRDKVQGGVAIRATEEEITVHPYTFRQVCSNGAIMAQAVQTRRMVESDFFGADQTEEALREAIRVCAAPEAFAESARQMRDSTTREVDMLLSIVRFAATHFPPRMLADLVNQVLPQFGKQQRGSRYDLMNAITATARDTRDPETRWRLEELGGAVAAEIELEPTPKLSARKRVERNVPMAV